MSQGHGYSVVIATDYVIQNDSWRGAGGDKDKCKVTMPTWRNGLVRARGCHLPHHPVVILCTKQSLFDLEL